MGVLSDNAIIGASAAGGYDIDYSCRFDEGSSGGLLSRTQTTPTGDKAFTYSFWFKGKTDIGGLTGSYDWDFLDCISADNDIISFGRNDPRLYFSLRGGSGGGGIIISTMKFRDPSSWYHVVVAVDTTQATAANRMRMYKNGVEITAFDTANYCNQNYTLENFNTNGTSVRIGNQDGSYPGGCMMSEVHFIDGQQLTPSSFGETDVLTNEWKAIKYAGTYGNNGFFLEFKSSGALGTDTSGNGNNWTVSNLAVDNQIIDTPQNSTGGNFCTMNPLVKATVPVTFTEGNLKTTPNTDWQFVVGTMPMSSGKWYWELLVGGGSTKVGILVDDNDITAGGAAASYGILYYPSNKIIDNTWTSYGAAFTTGDIIGYAVDMDGSTVTFYKNGVSQGAIAFSGSATTAQSLVPGGGLHTNTANWNFGADSSFGGAKTAQNNKDGNDNGDFYYTPPSGYLALCTNNLPDPGIALPGENFNTIIWSGSGAGSGGGSVGNRAFTGVGFQPDLVWGKQRTNQSNYPHILVDSVRTAPWQILSNSTSIQYEGDAAGNLASLDSDGFSTTEGAAGNLYWNRSGSTFVAWNWKAGGVPTVDNSAGAGATPTAGSVKINGSNLGSALAGTIPATRLSANTTAGFSIVGYEGTGVSGATVAHGLSETPELLLFKNYTDSRNGEWAIYSNQLTSNHWYLVLNNTTAQDQDTGRWNDTSPTSSVFSLGDSWIVNQDGEKIITYCFHSVEGYSKVGEYASNNVADGPFIYLGFTPAYIMLKCMNATDNWNIYDIERNGYNGTGGTYQLRADGTDAGFTSAATMVDLVSNGMKIRTNDPGTNGSSRNYMYIAFADNPFKTSRAR